MIYETTLYKASEFAKGLVKIGTFQLKEKLSIGEAIEFDGIIYSVIGFKHKYKNPYGQDHGNLSEYNLTFEAVLVDTKLMSRHSHKPEIPFQ